MNSSDKIEFFKQTILYNCYITLLSLFDNKELVIKKIDNQSKNIYKSLKYINKNNNVENEYICFYYLLKYLSIPNIDFIDLYNNGAKKLVYNGLIIEEKLNDKFNYYGELMNEIGLDFLANICLMKKYKTIATKTYNDLLYTSTWIYNKRKHFRTIIRLLILAMNNDFNHICVKFNKSFIDNKIYLRTIKGYLYQTVPANDFLYGLIYDGLYTEKQFDKYSSKGDYKLLCEKLDDLYHNNIIDKSIIKEAIIIITAMYKNKIYYLEHYKVINDEIKKNLFNKFDIILKQAIKEFELKFTKQEVVNINKYVIKSKKRFKIN